MDLLLFYCKLVMEFLNVVLGKFVKLVDVGFFWVMLEFEVIGEVVGRV